MHAIVVAGTHSGVGKTSVTLGLIGALRERGHTVQPFKVGPDFIDPLHHSAVAGRPCHNLDGWMLSPEANLELFARHTAGVDVAVVEGMMGLFDGADPRSNRGSAAEMANWLGAPVLLVIDASAMARSAAALVHGYASFDPGLRIAGVLANRVGSAAHAELIAGALERGPDLLGWLPSDDSFAMPERHLGLTLPGEQTGEQVARLCAAVGANVDLDLLLERARVERPPSAAGPARPAARARIGVARDEAFSFYYEDNLIQLADAGAELVEVSPLRDELPAGLDGLYLGGGYPELHAARLAANAPALAGIRELAARGRPVYGECGGLIYLGEEVEVDGERHALCGVLPVRTEFPARLRLGYVEVRVERGVLGAGRTARGHWFHRADVSAVGPDAEPCYRTRLARGGELGDEGFAAGSVLGSWVHLHFRSSPGLAASFVEACAATSSAA